MVLGSCLFLWGYILFWRKSCVAGCGLMTCAYLPCLQSQVSYCSHPLTQDLRQKVFKTYEVFKTSYVWLINGYCELFIEIIAKIGRRVVFIRLNAIKRIKTCHCERSVAISPDK
jgi:hypothetical protein